MKPIISFAILAATCSLIGCAQSLLSSTAMEQRVIEQFTDALQEENEPALRRIASSRFENTALRSDDVLTDLRVLHLPSGDLSIVEVAKVGEDRREVIVKEETGGKYQFQLVRDPVKNYWAVDDVMVRQRTRGTRMTKSTTEVMDLLVTLRQFLKVWESGTREEILAMTSPSLSESLNPLPDEWLQSLTSRIASNYEDGMARKPEANLNENDAVVKLPSKNGHILLSISRVDGQWLVDDVEAHNHREDHHPGSVKRQADAINAVNAFLTAYSGEDRETLQAITHPKFYSASLKLADLSIVSLPKASEVPAKFDLRAFEDQLTFMIPAGREVVRVDLQETSDEEISESSAATSPSRFHVKNVTLYDRSTQRQRSLSSIFTAPTRASLFLKALANRDHEMLSQISTTDFSKGTWKRASPDLLAQISIPTFYGDGLKMTDSHTVADRTELEFQTDSGQLISCRMLTQNGSLKIDDVQFPNDSGQVTSLRTQLELSIPVLEFAAAWARNDMESIQKSCSSDFNRLVWSHLEAVPERFNEAAIQLGQRIRETRITPERATVSFGDKPANSTSASLVQEHGYWVVDEVRTSRESGQFVAMRENLRREISDRLLSGSYTRRQSHSGHNVIVPVAPRQPDVHAETATTGIEQVSAQATQQFHKGAVKHAIFEREQRPDGTFAPAPVRPAVKTETHLPRSIVTAQKSQNGVINAGYEYTPDQKQNLSLRKTAARSSTGVQVFGPNAAQVANSFDKMIQESANPEVANVQPAAIDTTPTAAQNSPATDDSFMYFGPNKEDLASGRKLNSPVVSPAEHKPPRRITEPADMPIPIE